MLPKNKYTPLSNEERAKAIGSILKFLRQRAGLSQGELCLRLNMNKQTYAGYENGRHEPRVETLIQLSYFYDVNMDFITGKSLLDNDGWISPHIREMLSNLSAEEMYANKDKLNTMFENINYMAARMKETQELMNKSPDIKALIEDIYEEIFGHKVRKG